MPVMKDGTRAEVICNPLGVPNRLNPGQLYEHEINFISHNIENDAKKMTLSEAKKFIFDYIKELSVDQYESINEFYKGLNKKDKGTFIKELREYIQIHQPPFWNNLDFEGLEHLYDKYGYHPEPVMINGYETENPVIIADMYMIRLKHEPQGKFSARSTSFINLKNNPSKSLAYKKHEEPYSKTPIRVGEMELVNLLLGMNSKIQSKFNSFYSNNEINRRALSKKLVSDKNVLDIDKIDLIDKDNSSKTLLNVLFKTLGIRLKKVKKKKKVKKSKK